MPLITLFFESPCIYMYIYIYIYISQFDSFIMEDDITSKNCKKLEIGFAAKNIW